MTVVAAVAEVATIGLVVPFLGVLSNPHAIFENPLTQPVIGLLGLQSPEQLLAPVSLAFCMVALGGAAVRLALIWGTTRYSQMLGADLGAKIYRTLLYQPYAFHAGRNSGELIATTTGKVAQVIGTVLNPLLLLATSALILCSILVGLMLVAPYITMLSFAGFGLMYAGISFSTRGRLKANSKTFAEQTSRVVQALQEG